MMQALNGLPSAGSRGKQLLRHAIRLAAVAITLTAAAHASTLDFTFSPTNGVGGTYSFSTPQSPSTGATAGSGYFTLTPTGTGGFFAGPDTVFFITAGSPYAGTIQLINSNFSIDVYLFGPQLFTGSEDAPTYLLGSFLLTNFTVPSPTMNPDGSVTTYPVPDGDQVGQSYNLVVTQEGLTTVTPEPSSFLLLGTGLIGSLGIARRKWAKF